MSDLYVKYVEFDKWCNSCEYSDNSESDSPCDDCLSIPARENSHKPEYYKAKDGSSTNSKCGCN